MSVENTLKFFQIAKPTPSKKDFFGQVAVHFEEFQEMVEALVGKDNDLFDELSKAIAEFNSAKSSSEYDINSAWERIDFNLLADSLADQMVTATGVARQADIDIISVLDEVSKSNLSKFYYVGEGEITPQQLSEFTQDCVDIEKQGRYSEVCWERIGEYVVFFDMNNKILKSPRTYF